MDNCIAWAPPAKGMPVWPVYVCDVDKMRPDHLHYLGKSHTNALERAYSNVKYALVYYLGLYVLYADSLSSVYETTVVAQ
ncbi:unnamed protein product [Aphanomyces euteiches]